MAPPAAATLFESRNPAMQRAIDMARRVATSDASLLLTGENGVGKSLLARTIHAWSARRDAPFVSLSCTALADPRRSNERSTSMRRMVEGAKHDPWRLDAARGGTLFVDEIGDLPIPLQSELVRALTERGAESAEACRTIDPHARVIAATARNLEAEVRAGRFREDLFFLVGVVAIALPPLRERAEDIPALTDHILADLAVRHRRGTIRVAPQVRRLFRERHWTGNVLELATVLEHAVVLCAGDTITAEHVPSGIASASSSLEELRRQHITRILDDSATLKDAADRLGIDPSTLWRNRKRWGLD